MKPVEVLDACSGVTTLTVDFFDTLVTRCVAQPTHVFAVMEKLLVDKEGEKWDQFALRRVEAEHQSRFAASGTDEYRDVTIDEIYLELARNMNLSMSQRARLIQLEKDQEVAHSVAVPFGVAVTNLALERGLRVVVISDNYMPPAQLVAMAHAVGYQWLTTADIFVSCEHGAMKHNGKLWPIVLDALKVAPSLVLHIGDDAVADGSVPSGLGINTYVRDAMRRSHRHVANTAPAVLPLSRIEAMYRDEMDQRSWDAVEVLGGGMVAMVVAAQIADVQRVIAEREIAGIHFAARDGCLAYTVWNRLRDAGVELPPATYTAFSRSVAWRANMTECNEKSIGRFVGDDEVLTIERLERRLGCSLVSTLGREKLISADIARSVVIDNADVVVEGSRQLRHRMVRYLENQGCMTPGHHLVIDLGWTGQTVADLADLIVAASDGKATVEGRFTGLYWDATPQRRRLAMNAFAVDEFSSVGNNVRLLGGIRVLEALITAPHGSVVDFTEDGEPVFVDTQPELRAFASFVGQLDEYAMDSAYDMLMGKHRSGVTASDISGEVLWASMMQVIHSPRTNEQLMLSAVNHLTSIDHEGEGRRLIAPAPEKPSEVLSEELPSIYDTLIHRHWLQGTLSSWHSIPDARWIADEIYKLWPLTHPQWIHIKR